MKQGTAPHPSSLARTWWQTMPWRYSTEIGGAPQCQILRHGKVEFDPAVKH